VRVRASEAIDEEKERRWGPPAAGPLKSQRMATNESVLRRRRSEKMGDEMATKLSCWLVSMMQVAVVKRRMPWSRGTSKSSHQRELREEGGWPVAGPLKL
jgi:hypothetical protein